jgi:hypothetical protein
VTTGWIEYSITPPQKNTVEKISKSIIRFQNLDNGQSLGGTVYLHLDQILRFFCDGYHVSQQKLNLEQGNRTT